MAVSLLGVDPDLAFGLSEQATLVVGATLLDAYVIGRNSWLAESVGLDDGNIVGLLVLDGLVLRRSEEGTCCTVELLGPGDLIPYGNRDGDGAAGVSQLARWQTAERSAVAIIDARSMASLAAAPEVIEKIIQRMDRTSQFLRLRLGLARLGRLEDRLYRMFWHLADRWGYRKGGQTFVELPVSQSVLGELLNANRSSISLALAKLIEEGRIAKAERHVWQLF